MSHRGCKLPRRSRTGTNRGKEHPSIRPANGWRELCRWVASGPEAENRQRHDQLLQIENRCSAPDSGSTPWIISISDLGLRRVAIPYDSNVGFIRRWKGGTPQGSAISSMTRARNLTSQPTAISAEDCRSRCPKDVSCRHCGPLISLPALCGRLPASRAGFLMSAQASASAAVALKSAFIFCH
jgi:hypothetical protein